MAGRIYWMKKEEARQQLRHKFSALMREKSAPCDRLARHGPSVDQEGHCAVPAALSEGHDGTRRLGPPRQGPGSALQDFTAAQELWFDAVETTPITKSTGHLRREASHPAVPAQRDGDWEEMWFDAVATPAELKMISADDAEIWYDARDSNWCDISSERALTGEGPPPLPTAQGHSDPVNKLFNMTGAELEPSLISVLERGPKFAITQNVTRQTLNEVEVGIERAMYALRWKVELDKKRASQAPHAGISHRLKPRFPDNDAAVPCLASAELERDMGKLKRKIIGLYKNQQSSKANIQPEEEEALKKLAHDENLIVKPSDKCKGLVVMDKVTYVEKALNVLSSYEKVSSNPTPKVEASTKRVIKSVMGDKTDKTLVQSLLPQGSRTAEFYGLPKNHKDNVPLRPIVSACGGPLDKMTWFLEQILSQLVKYVPCHLPNTDTYLRRLKQRYPHGFPPGTILFSLDVSNLYGNIPIDEAVQTVMNLLQEHRDTVNLFGLAWTDVEPLLHHCLSNSFLRFGDSYYEQTLGLPMGSRIAPSTAIIFMGALEDIFLSSGHAQPDLYMRYIDDCFCVWTHGADALNSYFEYVNTVHPTIKFTIERSDTADHQGQIPFLDTLISLRPDGHYSTQLYVKPVAASIILPFDSAQPFKVKRGVAKSQFLRALKVSSDPDSARRSTDIIYSLFRANGYPSRWLNGVARQARSQHESSTAARRPPRKDLVFVALPFINDALTRRVDAALKSVNPNLTSSWKNTNTITKRLVHSALEPPPCRAGKRHCRTCDSGLRGRCTTKNVVYQVTCDRCAAAGSPTSPVTYVGETKRCVRYRFDEHFRDGVNRTQQTPFGDHMSECHSGDPEPRLSIRILRRCKDAADRKIAEALAIRDRQPQLNSQVDTWPLLA